MLEPIYLSYHQNEQLCDNRRVRLERLFFRFRSKLVESHENVLEHLFHIKLQCDETMNSIIFHDEDNNVVDEVDITDSYNTVTYHGDYLTLRQLLKSWVAKHEDVLLYFKLKAIFETNQRRFKFIENELHKFIEAQIMDKMKDYPDATRIFAYSFNSHDKQEKFLIHYNCETKTFSWKHSDIIEIF